MTACAACGHDPVTGSHCPACGAIVGSGSSPAPGAVPPPARFPLYADEASPPQPTPSPPPPVGSTPEGTAEAADTDGDGALEPSPVRGGSHAAGEAGPGALPLLVGAAVVLLFAVLGGALLLLDGGDDDATGAVDPATSASEPAGESDDASPTEAAAEPDGDAATETTDGGRRSPADVSVPGSAAASNDNRGNRVTYEAAHLFDEDPRTAWRVAGDATGDVLTFRFDEPVTLTEVGLVNGYAKEDPPNDWYPANRRVLEVEWSFGDGVSVRQELTEDRALQTTEVDAVETDVVELRLTEVTAPGSRDYTALSEVRLTGSAG